MYQVQVQMAFIIIICNIIKQFGCPGVSLFCVSGTDVCWCRWWCWCCWLLEILITGPHYLDQNLTPSRTSVACQGQCFPQLTVMGVNWSVVRATRIHLGNWPEERVKGHMDALVALSLPGDLLERHRKHF